MKCKDQNQPSAFWEFVKKFPALRYMKPPVFDVYQLYERYFNGLEAGCFAFVIKKFAFYGWNNEIKQWLPIGKSGDDAFPEGSVTDVTVGFLPAGSDVSGLSAVEVLTKILFGKLFEKPVFTGFSINPKKLMEVGEPIPAGTVFAWSIDHPENVKPNSITVYNETAGSAVASGLNGTSFTLSSPVNGLSSPGNLNFSLQGKDMREEDMEKAYVQITFGMKVYRGSYSGETVDSSQIAAFTGELKTGYAGDYSFDGGNYKYICVPKALGTPTAFIDPVTNFNVPMMQQTGTVQAANGYGISVEYNVWRSYYKLTEGLTIKLI